MNPICHSEDFLFSLNKNLGLIKRFPLHVKDLKLFFDLYTDNDDLRNYSTYSNLPSSNILVNIWRNIFSKSFFPVTFFQLKKVGGIF